MPDVFVAHPVVVTEFIVTPGYLLDSGWSAQSKLEYVEDNVAGNV